MNDEASCPLAMVKGCMKIDLFSRTGWTGGIRHQPCAYDRTKSCAHYHNADELVSYILLRLISTDCPRVKIDAFPVSHPPRPVAPDTGRIQFSVLSREISPRTIARAAKVMLERHGMHGLIVKPNTDNKGFASPDERNQFLFEHREETIRVLEEIVLAARLIEQYGAEVYGRRRSDKQGSPSGS